MAALRRTGAQRLRERVARAALVRVPVELAADCVPEAPRGVVRVRITATVHTRARDGRQALARRLGLEPRVVSRAAVAVGAADGECCTDVGHGPSGVCVWHPVRVVRNAAAVPTGGLSVGTFALDPANRIQMRDDMRRGYESRV